MRWYKRIALLLVFWGILGTAALAQEIRTFPLNEPMKDEVLACLDKGAAMELFNARKAFEEAKNDKKKEFEFSNLQFEFFRERLAKKCDEVSDIITYRVLVSAYKAENGTYLTVYEAEARGYEKIIYVLLINWRHFRMEI